MTAHLWVVEAKTAAGRAPLYQYACRTRSAARMEARTLRELYGRDVRVRKYVRARVPACAGGRG